MSARLTRREAALVSWARRAAVAKFKRTTRLVVMANGLRYVDVTLEDALLAQLVNGDAGPDIKVQLGLPPRL